MRKVALAGVLAMQPEVLVLDEPTAGLDPRGCNQLQELIEKFHRELGMTVIQVTHEMGAIARAADYLIILNRGEIAADGAPTEIFSQRERIRELGLGIPPFMELADELRKKGIEIDSCIMGVDEAAREILKLYRKKTGR